MKLLSSLICLSMMSYLVADGKKLQTRRQVVDRVEAIGDQTIDGTWEGKVAPHYQTNGFILSADFLYWKADEDNLEYAQDVITSQSGQLGTASDPLQGTGVNPNFKWNPGFRVAIGKQLGCLDYWDIYLSYNYIKSTADGSKTANFPQTIVRPTWDTYGLGSVVAKAQVNWDMFYNTWDLELGKDYFLGTRLTLRPFLGVRGAWIKQKYHTKYDLAPDQVLPNINQSKFKAHQHYWGVGARAGSNFIWHLSKNWGIYGEISGALLYGASKVKEELVGVLRLDELTEFAYIAQETFWRTRGTLQAALGIEWEMHFNQNRSRFALSAGYEFNTWFQFNQLLKPNSDISLIDDRSDVAWRMDTNNGDLSLQGLVIRATYDF